MQYKISILSSLSALLLCTACSQDELNNFPSNGKPAEIIATIGTAQVQTKVNSRTDDNISYAGFSQGDKIGFFSSGGLTADNKELTYSSGAFKAGDLTWTDGKATNIFAYFPYSNDNNVKTDGLQINIWRNANSPGPTWNDGYEDILTPISSNLEAANGTAVSLGFKHQFAMLIIKGGNGFEKAAQGQNEIKVTLDKPFTKEATITSDKKLEIGIDESATSPEITANNGIYDPTKANITENNVAYAIVPVGSNTTGKRTFKITLTSDANHEVSVNYTFAEIKSNYKYLLNVIMRDDQILIEPEEIRVWTDEEVGITKPKGIENLEDFKIWLSAYNGTVGNTGDFENESKKIIALLPYGDYNSDTHTWIFRLLEEINATDWNSGTYNNSVITTFNKGDVLDGQGHAILNLKLKDGFFGTLTGTVKNLKLQDLQVDGKSTSTSQTGGIAATIGTDATIENCHITGFSTIAGNDNVGALVGNFTANATIKNCTSSAIVSGTGTTNVNLLIGTGDSNGTNCSTTTGARLIKTTTP